MFALIGAVAQLERELIAERTKRGAAHRPGNANGILGQPAQVYTGCVGSADCGPRGESHAKIAAVSGLWKRGQTRAPGGDRINATAGAGVPQRRSLVHLRAVLRLGEYWSPL